MDLLFVIILGALWGSFANVCIYRLPLNKGVTMGRSYCPKCKKKITWKDNIPIISYFLLSGKCRKCKKPIPKQYVLVEFLSILFFSIIYLLYGIALTTILLMILRCFLYFLDPTFLDFQVPRSPNSNFFRFPDFQTPPAPVKLMETHSASFYMSRQT